nr:uncharacterized protein LOC121116383 [Lepeophtheirus salmonis]
MSFSTSSVPTDLTVTSNSSVYFSTPPKSRYATQAKHDDEDVTKLIKKMSVEINELRSLLLLSTHNNLPLILDGQEQIFDPVLNSYIRPSKKKAKRRHFKREMLRDIFKEIRQILGETKSPHVKSCAQGKNFS